MNEPLFYLHSRKNRQLYPANKYPLTHLIDYQSLVNRLSKQSTYVKHFKYTFLFLFLLILVGSIFFRVHIYLYNTLFGPFHQNFEEFREHIQNFEKGQSWFKRIEYIQIELGENNIQNSIDSSNTIKKYSDIITRRNHIATYKQVKKLNLYIKLPAKSQRNYHLHHPFDFSSYTIRTLKCIVKYLQTNSEVTKYKTWIEKYEYVKYINEEYAKNTTLFNKLVLTKCGILIGYLYRPRYDKAFLPTQEYQFSPNDIAFDATRQYCSYYPLIIFSLIVLWLLFKGLFYFFIYLSNIIRCKVHLKISFLSSSLNISSNIREELWLLNLDDFSYQQLLKLDEFIQNSQYKLNNQLFIIKNDFEQLFVVLIKEEFDRNSAYEYDISPFIICPVTDIKKLVEYGGICYGRDLSWIPWPSTINDQEQNYSEWLHLQLMEISEDYKEQYEHRLQQESQSVSNFHDSNSIWNGIHRRRPKSNIKSEDERELDELIREEENHQRFNFERQSFYEYISGPRIPASPQFIAKFRIKEKSNENIIDSTMEKEKLNCVICCNDFKLNDSYVKWPCPSKVSHIFHFECMLKTLRQTHKCPICRHPVEASPMTNAMISYFFRNLVF